MEVFNMQIDPNSITWDPAPSQPTRAPGVIRGPAPTITPVDQERLQNEQARVGVAQQSEARQQREEVRDIEEIERKERGRAEAYQRAGQTVLRSTTRALEYLGRMSQGESTIPSVSRMAQAQIPGTDEYNFTRQIEDLKRNIGLDRLQQMRDNSPTGGALGQVPVQQQAMLEDTLGSFDISQSGEVLKENLSQLNNIYLDIMFGSPEERKEAVASGRMTQEQASDVERYYRETQFDLFGRRKEGGVEDGQSSDKANQALGRLLQSGATKEEILGLAKDLNLKVDEAALDANIRSRDEGGAISPFVSVGGGGPPDGGLTLSQVGQGLAEGAGDVVEGLGNVVGIVADPIARTLSDALGYDSSQLRSTGQAIREDVGLPQSPEGIGRTAREFAAGGLTFAGAARGLGTVASNTVARNALQTTGRTPIRDTVAGGGAGIGSEVGEEVGGTPGQIAGALAGGLGGYAVANRAANLGSGAPNALAQAANRQKVDLLPADAGGPVAQAVTTGTRASPLSVAPVANAAEAQQTQFGDAARRAATSQGDVLDTEQAGEAIRRGAKNFLEQSRTRGNRLYERAFEQSRGVKIKANQTARAAREAIEQLKENPAATPSEIQALEAFAENITGGVTIQGLRNARTKLSQSVYDGNMRSSSDQAMWKGILSNVADDIDAGLRSVGREDAANTFRVADRLWSERIEVIDQVLQPIIGKEGMKGGEQILQSIESAARGQSGGNARLSRVLGAMPKEEAANVRATIADRIGRATPGAQDAQGEAFSASTFLTNWNKMTPQAKTSLFPTKQMRDNLNDLAKIAEGTKRSQAMANTSNTGVAMNAAEMVRGAANIGAVGAGATASLPLTILGAGGVYATGRLMASPGFAGLLARTSRMPPEAANRTFREQLAILSTKEPVLADDISRLTQAINDNGRLAAQEDQAQN